MPPNMTIESKNNKGSDGGSTSTTSTDIQFRPPPIDHRHPNHTILHMCGTDNEKVTKIATFQTEIDIAEPVSSSSFVSSAHAYCVDEPWNTSHSNLTSSYFIDVCIRFHVHHSKNTENTPNTR